MNREEGKKRAQLAGESGRLRFNHKEKTFTWKSESNGDDLLLPEAIAYIMALSGYTWVQ